MSDECDLMIYGRAMYRVRNGRREHVPVRDVVTVYDYGDLKGRPEYGFSVPAFQSVPIIPYGMRYLRKRQFHGRRLTALDRY
jgi:hypothetical protein